MSVQSQLIAVPGPTGRRVQHRIAPKARVRWRAAGAAGGSLRLRQDQPARAMGPPRQMRRLPGCPAMKPTGSRRSMLPGDPLVRGAAGCRGGRRPGRAVAWAARRWL